MSPVDMFHVLFPALISKFFFSEKKNSPNTKNFIILHLHFCLLVSQLPWGYEICDEFFFTLRTCSPHPETQWFTKLIISGTFFSNSCNESNTKKLCAIEKLTAGSYEIFSFHSFWQKENVHLLKPILFGGGVPCWFSGVADYSQFFWGVIKLHPQNPGRCLARKPLNTLKW